MKEPVPPAHVPFIRCSTDVPKYMIFASSPPNSMATSVWGANFLMAFEQATTSCTKLTPKLSASPSPAEPVTINFNVALSSTFFASSNNALTVFLTSEK